MHPRNRYAAPHDFPALARLTPELTEFFQLTPDGRTTLDFTAPRAVRLLNQTLLKRDYGLRHWDLPPGHLCPGVPGRLDYVHLIADLLNEDTDLPPKDRSLTGLDVGTGASLIYPILAVREYGWRMVGTDIDPTSLRVARAIIDHNPVLKGRIELRHQTDRQAIFRNVVRPTDRFAFTMCNPPFFASAEEADRAADRKWRQLGRQQPKDTPVLNFGGSHNELTTPGGEAAFLRRMIRESAAFAEQVGWFTTLVSKKGYLRIGREELERTPAREHRTLDMEQGGKRRRILCWRF